MIDSTIHKRLYIVRLASNVKGPSETDPIERMVLREERCIGCGICAANCPNETIKMIKVRDNIPPEKNMIGNKTFLELI